MKVLAKLDGTNAEVFYRDGYFMFAVQAADGALVAGGGADRELPDLLRLVEASDAFIDWELEMDLLRDLRLKEIERLDLDAQRIAMRIGV